MVEFRVPVQHHAGPVRERPARPVRREPLAVDIFAANILLASLVSQATTRFIKRKGLSAAYDERQARAGRIRALSVAAVMAVSMAVVWGNADYAKYLWILIAFLPDIVIRVARRRPGRRQQHRTRNDRYRRGPLGSPVRRSVTDSPGYAPTVSQRRPLQDRVVAAAETALARQKFVTPIDVCLGIGRLQPPNLDDWRHGRVDDLDYFLPAHDDRSVAFLVHLAEWATAKGLKRVQADYVSATRSRRPLRFTSPDEPTIEYCRQIPRRWQPRDRSPDGSYSPPAHSSISSRSAPAVPRGSPIPRNRSCHRIGRARALARDACRGGLVRGGRVSFDDELVLPAVAEVVLIGDPVRVPVRSPSRSFRSSRWPSSSSGSLQPVAHVADPERVAGGSPAIPWWPGLPRAAGPASRPRNDHPPPHGGYR